MKQDVNYSGEQRSNPNLIDPEIGVLKQVRLARTEASENSILAACIAMGAIYPFTEESAQPMPETPVEVLRPRIAEDEPEKVVPVSPIRDQQSPLDEQQQRLVADHIARVQAVHDQIERGDDQPFIDEKDAQIIQLPSREAGDTQQGIAA